MICNIAFIFLAEHLMSHLLFQIHGISNTFVVHLKFSFETQSLSVLNSDSFKYFPDMDVQYKQIWSDCYGCTIFSATDHLCHELWCFLCHCGESQGFFPHQTIKLYFPNAFTNCISNYLQLSGVQNEECSMTEPQRRVEVNFLYWMVSTQFAYCYFRLDLADNIQSLTELLGTMAVFGIRKRMPRKNTEVKIHNLI